MLLKGTVRKKCIFGFQWAAISLFVDVKMRYTDVFYYLRSQFVFGASHETKMWRSDTIFSFQKLCLNDPWKQMYGYPLKNFWNTWFESSCNRSWKH